MKPSLPSGKRPITWITRAPLARVSKASMIRVIAVASRRSKDLSNFGGIGSLSTKLRLILRLSAIIRS